MFKRSLRQGMRAFARRFIPGCFLLAGVFLMLAALEFGLKPASRSLMEARQSVETQMDQVLDHVIEEEYQDVILTLAKQAEAAESMNPFQGER